MRVAFISRNTLFTVKGGDTVQIIKTAAFLEKLGVKVDIYTSSQKIDYSAYDILHGFNVIRPADLISHFKKFKKPKLLSTIYVDYSEFELMGREGILSSVFKLIGNDNTEYLKTFMRRLRNGEKSFNIEYCLRGHRGSLKKLIEHSNLLLPNSESEYKRLSKRYRIQKPYQVIPNAIDTSVFKKNYFSNETRSDSVISVARIDGIKNQLNLIRALRNTEFKLTLIGKPAPNHTKYYEQCQKEAGSNTTFITELEQEELIQYYLKAKVHAMPSWFETTGLSSLEAAAMGCNLVISDRGDTTEYFGNNAFYAEPNDPQSIYKAVKMAAESPQNLSFREKIFTEYIWEKTAEKTLAAYNTCLKNPA